MNKMGIFVREQAEKSTFGETALCTDFLCSPSFVDYNS